MSAGFGEREDWEGRRSLWRGWREKRRSRPPLTKANMNGEGQIGSADEIVVRDGLDRTCPREGARRGRKESLPLNRFHDFRRSVGTCETFRRLLIYLIPLKQVLRTHPNST
jgi:hypothetical protein